jgi:hypothetical protein
MTSLPNILNRHEFNDLSEHDKLLLNRYVRMFHKETPYERGLAIACIHFNNRIGWEKIPNNFINWLYYF